MKNNLPKKDFNELGYLKITGALSGNKLLNNVLSEVERIGLHLHDGFSILQAPQHIARMDKDRRAAFYRSLRYLPSVTKLASCDQLLDISRSLGIHEPAVMHSYNLRMDLPNEDRYLFHWHQDSTYLLGSENAITLWIPLVPVSKDSVGSIMLIPRSHRDGILPYRTNFQLKDEKQKKSLSPKDLFLLENPSEKDAVAIEAEPGDIIVFSQLLLHASLPNRGNGARWTVQVRHADFSEQNFIAAGYPMGDNTNILENNYLPGWSTSKPKMQT